MYYSMKNLGDENVKTLRSISDSDKKWRFISDIACDLGFSGIQLELNYFEEYGLSLKSVPDYIKESFRLTHHIEYLYHMLSTKDEEYLDELLKDNLRIATSIGVEDVSLHPPVLANVSLTPPIVPNDSPEYREQTREKYYKFLSTWIPRFLDFGITLSIESHVTSRFFVFTGITDYRNFILDLPGLGGLIDISHNCYDGIDMEEILSSIVNIPVNGFHLSDAIHGVDLTEGTHLPIGHGNVDFRALVSGYSDDSVYGALEVRGPARGIADSLSYLKEL